MKLLDVLSPWAPKGITDCQILGIQNDSRLVKSGDLFLAYPGARFDGRVFAEEAVHAGAIAIAYEPDHLPSSFSCSAHVPCVPIPSLALQLAAIASRFYDHPSQSLSILGVTGTNGKTTTAYLMAQAYGLLNQRAVYMGTLGHGEVGALQPLNNTTPDPLLLQQFFHDYRQKGIQQICMEVSSHALCQGRVDYVDFVGAIYTNLSHEHLDYHRTMDAYVVAKAKLFAVKSLKWAVINGDDQYGSFMSKAIASTCYQFTYGLSQGCDVRAKDCRIEMSGTTFEVFSPWGNASVQVNLLGQFNIYNTLAVLTSLLAQGFNFGEVIGVMKKLKASPGRMEVVVNSPCVIVDYAHTPDALEKVLSTLQQLKRGRLGLVFGCGGDRDKTKRPMMGHIASKYADFIIITSDNPRTEDPDKIVNDIAQGVLPATPALKIVEREEAIHRAIEMMEPQDVLLIAGKGHEAYQQIGTQCLPFSDQEVVRRLIHHVT